jgi:putative ABC transport system permease protein
MGTLFREILFGLRLLIKRPAFSAIAIATLALGIGANTALFSVVSFVMLRPLPYDDPARLMWIWETNPGKGIESGLASGADFLDWKSQSKSFVDMAAMGTGLPTVNTGDAPEQVLAGFVTGNYFSVLGARPMLGRTFSDDEDEPGKNHVLVSSYAFWTSRLGSNPNIVGRPIRVGDDPYTVIGVMPSGFIDTRPDEYKAAAFWTPRRPAYDPKSRRGGNLGVVGRLKADVSAPQAQQDMNAVAGAIEQQFPESNQGWRTTLMPLHERFVGEVRPALYCLLGAVGFLLLIACANVANMLLARATARERELAIRAALGAGRRRLLRQNLIESVVLALAGGICGVLVAMWGLKVLIRMAPHEIPRISEIKIDNQVLAFSIAISIFSGVVAGLLPALRASRRQLVDSLKEGGAGQSAARGTQRTGQVLASLEIALSMVLLIGAGLMANSFVRLESANLGFDPDRLLVFEIVLPPSKYPADSVAAFFTDLARKTEALPAVERTAVASELPVMGTNRASFEIDGRAQAGDDAALEAGLHFISPEYFAVIKAPLIAGRSFNEFDTRQSQPVAIINQTAARRYWLARDPIGSRISVGDQGSKAWLTIVGIAGDIRTAELTSELSPEIYLPHTQATNRAMSLIIRTTSDPMPLIPAVRNLVHEVDKDRPLWNLTSMEQLISDSVAGPRFNTTLILAFAGLALVLALLGIYGVFSYAVAQRTQEIGIRMALGAGRRGVTRLVVRQGLIVAIVGVGAGIGGALALTSLLASMLFGVTPSDPVTFGVCAVLMLLVALAATWVPAARASRVDPMAALRRG